ncbi:MAG: porphobilinogen synthase [Spirochaetes bacterium]|nr:MAG: porphobilinogen synthase [Spirochaetota bacterium]
MEFPALRLRRLRKNKNFRRMVRETSLSVDDFILPLFVHYGEGVENPIPSMPGNYQMSVENIVKECREVEELGIPAVMLFGIPSEKDEIGSQSFSDEGVVQRAVRAIKKEVPNLLVITDVCFCEYTSHGHCGVIKDGDVDNDETLKLLVRQALSFARAGADMVAPSDMMDGRVRAIREELDINGFKNLPIMAYSAKYSSAFYGPFREAAESAPQFGDRKSYQMDICNSDEALREVELDLMEGADMVMVKPALPYLDIIYRVKTEFRVPVAAYNVSGEFSAIVAACERGWLDREKVMMEVLYSIKRAGADVILTYFAKDAARILAGSR